MFPDPLNIYRPLLEDAAEKLHSLPDDVTEAYAEVQALDAAIAKHQGNAPADVSAVEHSTVSAIRVAARNGKPVPDASALRKASDKVADHEATRRLLVAARSQAAQDCSGAIQDQARMIIEQNLAPRHDELVTQLETVASILPANPTTDQLMRADEDVRQAWLALDEVVHVRQRLRQSAERLNRLSPPQHDHGGEFAVVKQGWRALWPAWSPGRTDAPWQSPDPKVMLLNIVRMGGTLWLPSSAQQDDAWMVVYGDKLRAADQGRADLRAYAAALG